MFSGGEITTTRVSACLLGRVGVRNADFNGDDVDFGEDDRLFLKVCCCCCCNGRIGVGLM